MNQTLIFYVNKSFVCNIEYVACKLLDTFTYILFKISTKLENTSIEGVCVGGQSYLIMQVKVIILSCFFFFSFLPWQMTSIFNIEAEITILVWLGFRPHYQCKQIWGFLKTVCIWLFISFVVGQDVTDDISFVPRILTESFPIPDLRNLHNPSVPSPWGLGG